MKNRKIYRKTLCFVWPRVPYCIAGGFALIWFPYLAIRITEKSEGIFADFLLVAMTAAGIFGAKFITSFGTKRANAAHLAMMTRGVVYGVLPEDVK